MTWPEWTSPDGRIRLINADCLEVLPLVEFDCVVTDPPYGMNATTANMNRGNSNCRWALPTAKSAWPTGGNDWDSQAPAIVTSLPERTTGGCIIWGGQFFHLPVNRCWLVWNKIIRNWQSSVCELAWTDLDAPVDAFDYSHGQLAHEGKVHPTQKPEPLIEWCVNKTTGVILDPFAGSCTTAIACIRTDRRCICIEKEERYWRIGIERCEREYKRTVLFNEQEAVS